MPPPPPPTGSGGGARPRERAEWKMSTASTVRGCDVGHRSHGFPLSRRAVRGKFSCKRNLCRTRGKRFSVVLRGLDPQPRLGLDRPQVAVGRAKPSQDKIGAAISPLHRRKRFSPDLERRLDRIEDRRRQVLGIGTVYRGGGEEGDRPAQLYLLGPQPFP